MVFTTTKLIICYKLQEICERDGHENVQIIAERKVDLGNVLGNLQLKLFKNFKLGLV